MIGESHPSITMTSQHKGFTVLQFEGKMQAEIMNYNIDFNEWIDWRIEMKEK